MTVKVLKRLIERKPSQISIRCESGERSGGRRARLGLHLSTKHPRKPTAKQQPGEKEEERRESSKKSGMYSFDEDKEEKQKEEGTAGMVKLCVTLSGCRCNLFCKQERVQ